MKKSLSVLSLLALVGCEVFDPTGGGDKTIERYESGQRAYEGYLADDGSKVGIWTRWYDNGQKESEGTYKADKQEGIWTYWHENGQKKNEGTYKADKLEGIWTRWYDNGQKESEGTFKNGEQIK